MSETPWSVYLLRCGDGSLYAGITTDLERRLGEHRDGAGKGAKYLRGRGPLQLIFSKLVGTRGLALRVEHQIKQLSKQEKETLVTDEALFKQILDQARAGQ